MAHLYRGELIESNTLESHLIQLNRTLQNDLLLLPPLNHHLVIDAIDRLMSSMDYELLKSAFTKMGFPLWRSEDLLRTFRSSMEKKALYEKYRRELGERVNEWHETAPGHFERIQPLGVLMHIGAGNVIALSAVSVLEGLLAGNINILKLPGYEGGISLNLLKRLTDLEPILKPYVYVFDISSKDVKKLSYLAEASDAAIVWGSDEAITGIRQLAPATLPTIEWGHRLSFAYMTEGCDTDAAVHGLAHEICLTDQLYCSSPQCVFVETDDKNFLVSTAEKLLSALEKESALYPQNAMTIENITEITYAKAMAQMEELLGNQSLLESTSFNISVIVDYKAELRSSPMYRNIWVMPVKRNEILTLLRPHKGHLQTVGLACTPDELEILGDLFYRAGVNRVTDCKAMSKTYAGEPHDGRLTLGTYTRRVVKSL